MIIRVGMENNTEERSMAWVLDYPGAFAYGKDSAEALLALPQRLVRYENWANDHAGRKWLDFGDFDIRLEDTWTCYSVDENEALTSGEGYEVNAWFRDDFRPLTSVEIQRGLDHLAWARADLLAIACDLPAATLDRTYPQERWNIRGILNHIARAECWYQTRLGLIDYSLLPEDVFAKLDFVRANLVRVLPDLEGDERVVGIQHEFWSPRKILRRAIWHEMDHIEHITKLL